GERPNGDDDARSVSADGETLIDLLHQRLDGNALGARRIDQRGDRLTRRRVEPGADAWILRLDGAEGGTDEEHCEETTSRTRSHWLEPSTTSALLGMPKS